MSTMDDHRRTEAMMQRLASGERNPNIEWTESARIGALLSLVAALETGMGIVRDHLAGKREPYPGAVDAVVRTSILSIEAGRRSGLLPERQP